VKQQIVSEHAEIIVRIMEMRASGLGFASTLRSSRQKAYPLRKESIKVES
jgi:hypothetical protein